MIYIGTAGWTIPTPAATAFPGSGTHLERYAVQFPATEINSTFYRAHQPSTYARWANSVPEWFRFSVKIPREITHEQRLVDVDALLEMFLLQATCLGEKFGCLLVQLPPTLQYHATTARQFFETLREYYDGPVAFEPRHHSWFTKEVGQQLTALTISRVGSDPAGVPLAAVPGGNRDFVYVRLHGSPRMYYSAYDDDALASVASVLLAARAQGATAWCIFDNTASGAAALDALKMQTLMSEPTVKNHSGS